MRAGLLQAGCLILCVTTAPTRGDQTHEFFTGQVLPILEQRCYRCHSHAAGKIEGGLALDSPSGLTAGGHTGPALAPGDPDTSLLIQAVRREGPEMPPDESLSSAQIAILEEWVRRGAPDPRPALADTRPSAASAWSFESLQKPTLPAIQVASVDETGPIDRFLRAQLEPQMILPAPPAQRSELIRRLTFDLTGLPPAPHRVDQFLDDDHPAAVERLVDRLFASPHYGERLARHWLDVAHYGESHGFGMDRPRMHAWPYRDYLIRSFNEDLPYASFVQQQLAADGLFADDPSLIPALGFLAAGPFNQSALAEQVDGTLCKAIALNLDRDDMLSSVATTFLSTTLHCARCHDHKFDPITMGDYYSMQSVFAGLIRGDRLFDTDASVAERRHRWQKALEQLTEDGIPPDPVHPADRQNLAAAVSTAVNELRETEKSWHKLKGSLVTESGKAKIETLPDGSILFTGELPDRDSYTMTAVVPDVPIAALRIEVLRDEQLPSRGPGRQPENGNLHLSELVITVAPAASPASGTPVRFSEAWADFSQTGWEIGKAIDGKSETAWGIHPLDGRSHQAVFVPESAISCPGGALLTVRIEQHHGRGHLIGRLRLSVAARIPSRSACVSPETVAVALKSATARTAEEQRQLESELAERIIRQWLESLPAPNTVFAVGKDLPPLRNYKPAPRPYPIHILYRGDVTKPKSEVHPDGIAAVCRQVAWPEVEDDQDERQRRVALARWIADKRNPLTWRSIANRLWLWHFDRGLVETANDFGRMGSSPSHPELLDWLALELISHDGSLKSLQRMIVTSGAYRQSSLYADPRGLALDPDNRLLWRMNRMRLNAEQIRDALLFASDRLDRRMGGPSVMQFVYSDPNPNVVPRIEYAGFDPDEPAACRRAVYRFQFRNVNDPLLEAFDAADPSLSTPQRATTITPLQALSLWNNRFVLRQCEHLAERLERNSRDVAERVRCAFWLLYARGPAEDELRDISGYAALHGWTNTCRVLLNSNEFLFVH